jgi:hypothetical protein
VFSCKVPSECQRYGAFLAHPAKPHLTNHIVARTKTIQNRKPSYACRTKHGPPATKLCRLCPVYLVTRMAQRKALFVDHIAKAANLRTIFVRPQSPDGNGLHETTQ